MSRSRLPDVPALVPAGARFAFGESPFRVKGVLYQGTQGFFDANLQGGMATLLAEIHDPELSAFISQRFLPSGWYDVMPVPALIAYEARALGMALGEYLVHRTRYQAKRDLGGVYGWVLRVASPSLVGARLPKIMSQMFDFVNVETEREASEHIEVRFHGVPVVLREWLHTALAIYADTAMKLAGARAVTVESPRASGESEKAGVGIVTLSFAVHWQ
jgi:hypothetical protein